MNVRQIFRVVTVMMAIMVILPLHYAEAQTTEEAYWENIELLSIYMREGAEAPVDIVSLRTSFQELHYYKLSTEFSMYAQVLEYLEKNDFDRAESWFSVLQLYSEFDEFVSNDEFSIKYPEIRGFVEMEAYINGRREQEAGNYGVASMYYMKCLKFFDSLERYQSLSVDLDFIVEETLSQIKMGDYANAVKNAEYLIANNHERGQALYDVAKAQLEIVGTQSTTRQSTPMPTSTATMTPEPTVIPTSTPVPAATATPTAQPTAQPTASWGDWSEWSTTKVEQDDTTQVEKKVQCRARDIIINQYYSDWGSWSEWSTSAASGSTTKEVGTQTQYRYRDTTTEIQYSDWSAWSEWSTTAVNETNLRDVETRTVDEPVYKTVTKYNYNRWRYWKTSTNAWGYSYAKYTKTPENGGVYGGQGSWQYKTTTSPLKVDHKTDGKNVYAGIWYNETTSTETVQDGTKAVTQYRYRSRTEKQVVKIGSWSDWSTSQYTSSSSREVETRTVYRYRTRELLTNTSYGNWSNWTDTWINENSERQVQVRTVYRYRKLQ